MPNAHYIIARDKCRALLTDLIATHGVSSLTPGIVRKELGDAMPKDWIRAGTSIDWSIAMDDVTRELVPKWYAATKEEKGLFGKVTQ